MKATDRGDNRKEFLEMELNIWNEKYTGWDNSRLNITWRKMNEFSKIIQNEKKGWKKLNNVSVSNKQPYAYVTGLPKGGKGEKTDRETDR